jgi:hypothetical protein
LRDLPPPVPLPVAGHVPEPNLDATIRLDILSPAYLPKVMLLAAAEGHSAVTPDEADFVYTLRRGFRAFRNPRPPGLVD